MQRVIGISLAGLVLALVAGTASAHTALDYPNGGEVFATGEVVTIQWHIWIPHPMENWDLWYTLDNGATVDACEDQPEYDWIPVQMDIPVTCVDGSGTCQPPGGCQMEYDWTIPDGIESDRVKVRVRMDAMPTGYYDVSDAPFTIHNYTSAVKDLRKFGFAIEQNAPNPFTRETEIGFTLAASTDHVRLRIHDAAGRLVRTLVDGPLHSGYHGIAWDGTADNGERLSSGTYFYTIVTEQHRSSSRLALIE